MTDYVAAIPCCHTYAAARFADSRVHGLVDGLVHRFSDRLVTACDSQVPWHIPGTPGICITDSIIEIYYTLPTVLRTTFFWRGYSWVGFLHGPDQFGSGRVGSGRVGSGRVGCMGDPTRPDSTRPDV